MTADPLPPAWRATIEQALAEADGGPVDPAEIAARLPDRTPESAWAIEEMVRETYERLRPG